MRRKTDKEYRQELYNLVGDEYTVLDPYQKGTVKIHIKHNKCGHVLYVYPLSFLQRPHCPYCSGRPRYTPAEYMDYVKEMTNDGYEVLDDFVNNRTPIRYKHKKCGTVFKTLPNTFSVGSVRCPVCANKVRSKKQSLTTEEFKERVHNLPHGDEFEVLSEYKGYHQRVTFKHKKCDTVWMTTPASFFLSKHKCPVCAINSTRKVK